tara:strand:+ start:273 stop:578 length:306 start_codon:yes stop_codon:yes gene_type:complete
LERKAIPNEAISSKIDISLLSLSWSDNEKPRITVIINAIINFINPTVSFKSVLLELLTHMRNNKGIDIIKTLLIKSNFGINKSKKKPNIIENIIIYGILND